MKTVMLIQLTTGGWSTGTQCCILVEKSSRRRKRNMDFVSTLLYKRYVNVDQSSKRCFHVESTLIIWPSMFFDVVKMTSIYLHAQPFSNV